MHVKRSSVLAIAAAGLGIGICASIVFDPVTSIRLAVAIAVVLVPGSLVVRAMYRGTEAGLAERAMLALSLGIAILTLGGLFLNLLPGGLTAAAWIAYIGVVAGAAAAAVRLEQRRTHAQATKRQPMAHTPPVPRPRIPKKDFTLFALAIVLGTSALGIARVAAQLEPTPPFTELWLVPSPDVPAAVDIGVRSAEHESTAYSVELISGPTLVQRWDFTLDRGGSWRMSVPISSPPSPVRPLEARLIRAGSSVPYRQAFLRVQTGG